MNDEFGWNDFQRPDDIFSNGLHLCSAIRTLSVLCIQFVELYFHFSIWGKLILKKYALLFQNPSVCRNCCAAPIDIFQIGIDLRLVEEHHLANYFLGSVFTFRAKLIFLQNFELLSQPVVDVGELLNLSCRYTPHERL